ncbi:M90 family metallopeptidase [Halobacteriovorax sp. JY17]|uniref:M90 family metallopeptidase n=1 Tax=Halobacteriovorax sp. JY17 TaxID=2014617 RepID=UPI000C414BFD|nr:M90 family metallopeptidase [Halobacteriovorax sp. JY17]PIK14803.1 MAG: hypothetical protein CES88_10730 [Halobacteriovorax sp. JY17]
MFNWFKNRRRKKYLEMEFSKEWLDILNKEMPLYITLNEQDKRELEATLKILYHEKEFIGAHGLLVTEEMKVLICAEASLLLLHRPKDYFPNVNTIVIYETTFCSEIRQPLAGGFSLSKKEARIGESNHHTKTVVLAWDSVKGQALNPHSGRNVVLHEFAHQLDSETGIVNGAPRLSSNSSYRAWANIMSSEFNHLKDDIKHHHKTFIDQYGATSGAEFFAVITESFFEKPITFKRKHPDLYDQLQGFYKQDPTSYVKR